MRPLGTVQRQVLRSLIAHKAWTPRCGWEWNTTSGTRRILESLRARGLVDVPEPNRYVPTDAGRDLMIRYDWEHDGRGEVVL